MADSVNVQTSGSWVGDTIGEFKKLPPWGKAIAILAAVGAVILIVHLRKSSSASPPAATSTGAKTTGGGLLPASSYPQDANTPVPYQPNYITPTTTTATPTATASTPSLFSVLTRGLWSGQTDNGSGGVPIWQDPNADWSKSVGGIPLNQQIQVGQGVQGNYFGKQATYYPVAYQGKTGYIGSWDLGNTPPVKGAPPPNSTPVGQGSSGDARGFHIVQYGENMNHVAHTYGLKSWRDFGVPDFWHGQKVGIPA